MPKRPVVAQRGFNYSIINQISISLHPPEFSSLRAANLLNQLLRSVRPFLFARMRFTVHVEILILAAIATNEPSGSFPSRYFALN